MFVGYALQTRSTWRVPLTLDSRLPEMLVQQTADDDGQVLLVLS